MDQLAGRDVALDRVEEAEELLVPVALHALADHRAVEHVERGEQGGGAVALVVVGHASPARPFFIGSPGWVRSSAWICWGGWPPHGISVPGWWLSKVTNREPSIMEITTIGLDLAKHVFQVHGSPRTARSCSRSGCDVAKCTPSSPG